MIFESRHLRPSAATADTLRVFMTGGGVKYDGKPLAELLAAQVLSLGLSFRLAEFVVTGPHLHVGPKDLCSYLLSRFGHPTVSRCRFEVHDRADIAVLAPKLLGQLFGQHLIYLTGLKTPRRYTEVWPSVRLHLETGAVALGENFPKELSQRVQRGSGALLAALEKTGRYRVEPVDGPDGPWAVVSPEG